MSKNMGRQKFGPASYWSPLRDLIMKRDWPNGIDSDEIKRRIDSTEGLPVPLVCIKNRARRLGVRRPDWFIRKVSAANSEKGRLKWAAQHGRSITVPATPLVIKKKYPANRFSMLGGTIYQRRA